MLEVKGLSKHFGGINAPVDNCSAQGRSGQITALIGPTGREITTAFNCISRNHDAHRPERSGSTGKTGIGPSASATRSPTKGPQPELPVSAETFADMTVLENVICQSKIHGWRGPLSSPL